MWQRIVMCGILCMVLAFALACEQIEDGGNGGEKLEFEFEIEAEDVDLEGISGLSLSDFITGTTWEIENVSSDGTYRNTTGQITFIEKDLIRLDWGRVAAPGIALSHVPGGPDIYGIGDITCKLIDDGLHTVLYLEWDHIPLNDGVASRRSNVVHVLISSLEKMKWVGSGGIGAINMGRVSILRRVVEE